jgi:hypothetical protein
MSWTRRQAIAGCGIGLATLIAPKAFAPSALAQGAYPSRNIKMIVPLSGRRHDRFPRPPGR